MSLFTGMPTEERNAANLIIDILKGKEGKTVAEVSVMAVTDQARSTGLKVCFAVWPANTAGRCEGNCARRHWHTKRCMGLGQTTREVWYLHRGDVFQ